MTLKDLPVFFLDLQTTGAKPGSAHILEVAWSFSQEKEIHNHLVQQPEGESVPRRILALTGLAEEDMSSALPLKEVFGKFSASAEKTPCVIHFAQFERPFLLDACSQLNLSDFDIICTHQIAKRLLPNLPARGIKGLAGYFGHASGEFKRGSSHIEATQVIWDRLLPLLAEAGIHTLEELKAWLQTAAPKKVKYEYPMSKEKRLGLPKQPGVYRMISQWNEVLYVGKATSLHDRVNSYFRGQKNRDSRKLEMLTQAWDLRVTPCRSPLESALLETDEIKKYNPRYNISLKAGHRELIFFSRDFLSMSTSQDEVHIIGPFSSIMVFDSMLKLAESLRQPEEQFNSMMFFEEINPDLLRTGFFLFCERHQRNPENFSSMRSILALGLLLSRHEIEEEEVEDLDAEITDTDEEFIAEESEEVELTPEDIADKFERHFKRTARAYLRSQDLTDLLNADIEYSTKDHGNLILHFRDGLIAESSQEAFCLKNPWVGKSIQDYDRMSVLLSELEKLPSRSGSFRITKSRSF